MFYDQLLRVCEMQKVSPSSVATSIGMSKANVTNWKNGASPNLATVCRIAKELDVPVTAFLENNDKT